MRTQWASKEKLPGRRRRTEALLLPDMRKAGHARLKKVNLTPVSPHVVARVRPTAAPGKHVALSPRAPGALRLPGLRWLMPPRDELPAIEVKECPHRLCVQAVVTKDCI